jgi:hypothetical protein
MLGVSHSFRLEKVAIRSPLRPAIRRAQLLSKEKLLRAVRVMGPTLVALTFAGVAHTAPRPGNYQFQRRSDLQANRA